jgi:hypothetical protein
LDPLGGITAALPTYQSVASTTQTFELQAALLPLVKFNIVCPGPAPRRVTFELATSAMPPEIVNVPAGSSTTELAGAEDQALVMLAPVTPEPVSALHAAVAQIVVRLVMVAPAFVQSMARLGSMRPDQTWAEAQAQRQSKIRGRRNLRFIIYHLVKARIPDIQQSRRQRSGMPTLTREQCLASWPKIKLKDLID